MASVVDERKFGENEEMEKWDFVRGSRFENTRFRKLASWPANFKIKTAALLCYINQKYTVTVTYSTK